MNKAIKKARDAARERFSAGQGVASDGERLEEALDVYHDQLVQGAHIEVVEAQQRHESRPNATGACLWFASLHSEPLRENEHGE